MGGSWLDRGHGDGESLVQVAGVPARDMIRRSDRGSAGWNSRSTKAIVGALATAALIGSAGTAYAIRETLFPTLGAPTSRSVWSNPVPVEEPAEVTVASVTTLDVDGAGGDSGSRQYGAGVRVGNGDERGRSRGDRRGTGVGVGDLGAAWFGFEHGRAGHRRFRVQRACDHDRTRVEHGSDCSRVRLGRGRDHGGAGIGSRIEWFGFGF